MNQTLRTTTRSGRFFLGLLRDNHHLLGLLCPARGRCNDHLGADLHVRQDGGRGFLVLLLARYLLERCRLGDGQLLGGGGRRGGRRGLLLRLLHLDGKGATVLIL